MFPTTSRNATPLICEISRQTKPAFISEIRDSFRQILFYLIALPCLNIVFRIVVWWKLHVDKCVGIGTATLQKPFLRGNMWCFAFYRNLSGEGELRLMHSRFSAKRATTKNASVVPPIAKNDFEVSTTWTSCNWANLMQILFQTFLWVWFAQGNDCRKMCWWNTRSGETKLV